MHLTAEAFLPRNEQNLGLARNLGDALAVIAERLWPHNRAKIIEDEWGLDRTTARNAVKGVVGATVVTKAIRSRTKPEHDDAWELWLALGREIIGEPLESYEERKVSQLIETTQNARSLHEARRARRAVLAERASFASASAAGANPDKGGRRAG